ncbi:hypothetical protein OC844_008024, partial [Tilletia horrida]
TSRRLRRLSSSTSPPCPTPSASRRSTRSRRTLPSACPPSAGTSPATTPSHSSSACPPSARAWAPAATQQQLHRPGA